MVDLLNKKKIKRLIAQGNRLEAMNIFLQSKFGDFPKQYSNEKIMDDSSDQRKKSPNCQSISEENGGSNKIIKKGSTGTTINDEEIAVVDVETVDSLSLEETVDPLSLEETVDPLSVEETFDSSTVEGKMTSSVTEGRIVTSVPCNSYLATTHHLKASQSDIRATPLQAEQQVPA
ncbi:unnamed protein product, partial [Meganyctiphanes norvegica]